MSTAFDVAPPPFAVVKAGRTLTAVSTPPHGRKPMAVVARIQMTAEV